MSTDRQTLKRKAAASLSALLFAVLFSSAQAQESDKQEREKLEKLRESIEQLKENMAQTRSAREELLNALEESEKRISELNRKAESLKKQIKQRDDKLDDLEDEKQDLESKKKNEQAEVGQHINAAYRLGSQSSLKMLLNQQDPATVSRNLRYYDYLIEARSQKIHDYVATIDRLNSVVQEIADQQRQLREDRQQLAEQQRALTQQQSRREQTIASLEAELSGQHQQLTRMEEDRKRLARLIEQVSELLEDNELAQDTADFTGLKGRLPWPAQGSIAHRFGSARAGNEVRWQGMVINAGQGADVQAVHHGRVVFSDYLRGHGLLIIIDHGGGYMSLYAHNEALYKDLGDWVTAGERIATVGKTGGQRESALYFELRHNGKPTNPHSWLQKTG